MARVLLVKAAKPGLAISGIVPPLGLLSLAAVLRNAGHSPRIYDAGLEKNPLGVLRSLVEDWRPHIIGISALTIETGFAVEAIKVIRAWNRAVPVVIGGPQATAMPEKTLAWSGADAVVAGEAEDIIVPLVEAMLERAEPKLPGVFTSNNATGNILNRMAPPPALDALPLPAWDLVDMKRYFALHSTATPSPWRYATIVMSRGCPWHCVFCHNMHGKKLRKRSVEHINAELEYHLRTLGSAAIEILDDTPNLDLDWAKSVLERFLRTNGRLRPAYTGGLRTDRMDLEFIRLMAAAKTAFANLAFESGDPEVQKLIKKHLDLEAARRNASMIVREGIYCNGTFMLGFPGETLEQMLKTVRYALSLPIPQALFFRVVPLPGSELWEYYAQKLGERIDDFDDYFFSNINLSAVPDRVFRAIHAFAYAAFYSSPSRAWRVLRLYPNRKMLPIRVIETCAAFGSRVLPRAPWSRVKDVLVGASRVMAS